MAITGHCCEQKRHPAFQGRQGIGVGGGGSAETVLLEDPWSSHTVMLGKKFIFKRHISSFILDGGSQGRGCGSLVKHLHGMQSVPEYTFCTQNSPGLAFVASVTKRISDMGNAFAETLGSCRQVRLDGSMV